MFNRRSFFRHVAAVVAAVALAPEIAFRTTLEIPKLPPLDLQEMFDSLYSIMRARKQADVIDVVTDRAGIDFLKRNFSGELAVSGAIKSSWPSPSGEFKVLGILKQLRSMPRPLIDNRQREPIFCKDCGKEGVGLCMDCYDARLEEYNATV